MISTTAASLWLTARHRLHHGGARRLGASEIRALDARPWPHVHAEVVSALRTAEHVLAWRADSAARFLQQTSARYELALPNLPWADVRPAYVEPQRGVQHSLAAAMHREELAWEGQHHRAEANCRALLAVMRAIAGR